MTTQQVYRWAESFSCVDCGVDMWVYSINDPLPLYVFEDGLEYALCDSCALAHGFCPECGEHYSDTTRAGMCPMCVANQKEK